MASMIAAGVYDVVLGSRILGGTGALAGGMPLYKYVANRVLTVGENLLLGAKLSEYHTGYRAFSRERSLALPLHENSDDFVFDNQMLAQAVSLGFHIGEVSLPDALPRGLARSTSRGRCATASACWRPRFPTARGAGALRDRPSSTSAQADSLASREKKIQ